LFFFFNCCLLVIFVCVLWGVEFFYYYYCLSDAELRERLNKIMASDYFTTTPEMKAPVEVAAAAGNYVPFQVPFSVPVQVDDSVAQYQPKV
jgi:hypothetical protein